MVCRRLSETHEARKAPKAIGPVAGTEVVASQASVENQRTARFAVERIELEGHWRNQKNDPGGCSATLETVESSPDLEKGRWPAAFGESLG